MGLNRITSGVLPLTIAYGEGKNQLGGSVTEHKSTKKYF